MRLCFTGNPGSIHTQRWVGHFAHTGHEVHLINLGPQPARKFDWLGPQHHNLPVPPMAPIPGLRGVLMLTARRRALIALLRQIQPDVLHAQSVADPGWFAALSGFHPLVLTAWGSDVLLGLHRGPRLHRWLTRNALHHADLLTADARSVLEAAQPYFGSGTRTALIRFGVDTQVFCPGADTTWRARLGLGPGPVLLSIRQCHPLYNIDIILRAFARIREELPTVRLLVKLVAQSSDDPYLAEMCALAGQLALDDAIVYVPQVSYAEIPDLYRVADLVLSVPSSDALPVSVLEAMACGTPVIASDLPALRELTDDGAELSLVPARDVQALSRAILALLTDPARRAHIVEQNLTTVRRNGDFAVEMAHMEDLYRAFGQENWEMNRINGSLL